MNLTSTQKQVLKAKAHHLKPIAQIGKSGVSSEQIQTIKKHLEDHELIKIKFNEYKEQKEELSDEIVKETGAELIDLIGNTLIIYKEKTQ
jgi:RNA-binding protein